jgi:hypothetical protein
MARVLISYAHQDREAVENMSTDLQLAGHEVWIDRNITGGQAWWDQVLTNIEGCEVFLFAMSPESLSSDACQRECYYAYRVDRAIIPVQVAAGVSLRVLPADLQRLHIVDYVNQGKAELAMLVKAINGAKWGPLPHPLPRRPEVPVSYLQRIQIRLNDPRPLSAQEQDSILQWLEHGLHRADERAESAALLRRMRSRRDIDQTTAARIDADLGASPPPPPPPPAQAAPPRRAWGTAAFTMLVVLALVLPLLGLVVGLANIGRKARRGQAAALVVVGLVNSAIVAGVAYLVL